MYRSDTIPSNQSKNSGEGTRRREFENQRVPNEIYWKHNSIKIHPAQQ